MNQEKIEIRVHDPADAPTLIYLPGIHGDWTLVSSFRAAVAGRVRFVELTYPRTHTWSLGEYARHIGAALAFEGIHDGWLLAESFGSQVGWALIEGGFQPAGLILSGGFVRHPVGLEVELGKLLGQWTPRPVLQLSLQLYRRYARFRHRHAPETMEAIEEFTQRRYLPGERRALVHRLDLIAGSDFTQVAQGAKFPIFQLSGLWDPIVPWWVMQDWLRRECPSFGGSRIIGNADHAVLATEPGKSAAQVLTWMAHALAAPHRTTLPHADRA